MTEEQLRAELDAVYRSSSWKITAPLRAFSALMRGEKTVLYFLKRGVKISIRLAASQPRLRQFGSVMLAKFPTLKAKLSRALVAMPAPALEGNSGGLIEQTLYTNDIDTSAAFNAENMSPQAQAIYYSLKQAIDHQFTK